MKQNGAKVAQISQIDFCETKDFCFRKKQRIDLERGGENREQKCNGTNWIDAEVLS